MFRLDRCSVEREKKEIIEGEIIFGEDEIIAVDIPCHLSVESISPANQTQSTATVLLDYVLYIDTKHGVTIQPNDKIKVTTAQGQYYELRAGESHKYRLTTQTHCEVVKVA